jgi:hypothetical protein
MALNDRRRERRALQRARFVLDSIDLTQLRAGWRVVKFAPGRNQDVYVLRRT